MKLINSFVTYHNYVRTVLLLFNYNHWSLLSITCHSDIVLNSDKIKLKAPLYTHFGTRSRGDSIPLTQMVRIPLGAPFMKLILGFYDVMSLHITEIWYRIIIVKSTLKRG